MEISLEQSNLLLKKEELLPIGTVVLLEKANRKIMIIGVLQFNGNNQEVLYDYAGVLYPEGLIDPKNNYLFNKEQIKRIYYLGYKNEELTAFQKVIQQAKEKFYRRNN